MKLIAQEESMGCGIACVASIIGKSYKDTKKFFDNPEFSASRGFYCRELIKVLNKRGLKYDFKKFKEDYKRKLKINGSVVFIKRSKEYPSGHYLVKTKKGWMNPWINFPNISPAKAGFQKKLVGQPQWIIFQI